MSITEQTKICLKCKVEKNITCFVSPRQPSKHTQQCDTCRKHEYQRTRESQLAYRHKAYAEKKDQILAKMASKEEKEKRNARNKARRQTDPSFRISESLKVRIHEILKEYKDETSNYLLGANKVFLKKWLEYQFESEFSWDNFAAFWQIDHVIPVSFFDITSKDEQKVCFHWTNLRPLHKTKNIKKHAKIIKDDILKHVKVVNNFISLNPQYQECFEKSIWSRLELEDGKNFKDDDGLKDFLKLTIRSEASKSLDDLYIPKKYKAKLKT
jgi:hypothetical protein